MFRSALLAVPVLVIVLLLRGSDPSTVPATVATNETASAVQSSTLPAPPPTAPPTTAPPPTAPPATAAPETAPAPTSPPKHKRTTTSTPPGAGPPATDAPPHTAPPDPVAIPGDASAVIGLTNQERAAAGLGALTPNSALHAAAQRESDDMAAHTKMSHTGSDGSTVGTRASAAGYSWRTIGENIAAGYTSASSVMSGWMASAGHRANILNGAFQDIGVAVATGADGRKYWTMVLGA